MKFCPMQIVALLGENGEEKLERREGEKERRSDIGEKRVKGKNE